MSLLVRLQAAHAASVRAMQLLSRYDGTAAVDAAWNRSILSNADGPVRDVLRSLDGIADLSIAENPVAGLRALAAIGGSAQYARVLDTVVPAGASLADASEGAVAVARSMVTSIRGSTHEAIHRLGGTIEWIDEGADGIQSLRSRLSVQTMPAGNVRFSGGNRS